MPMIGRSAGFEVDVLLVSTCPLQAEYLHAYPDSLSDRQQQEEREMVVLQPCIEEHPDAHEVGSTVERMQPQRIRTNLVLFGQVDGNDIHQHAEDDSQSDSHPCTNPTVCTNAQMVDKILRRNIPLRIILI